MKCKYCNNNMTHISGDLEEYGDNTYKCPYCGTEASEIFGHGIYWREEKMKNYNSNCETVLNLIMTELRDWQEESNTSKEVRDRIGYIRRLYFTNINSD